MKLACGNDDALTLNVMQSMYRKNSIMEVRPGNLIFAFNFFVSA